MRTPISILAFVVCAACFVLAAATGTSAPKEDAKNLGSGIPDPEEDPELVNSAIDAETAPRPETVEPISTTLPLKLEKGDRIALSGNTLFDRMKEFGYFEAMLQQSHPEEQLVVRNLAWPADEPGLQPRPENFADTEQHLFHEKADVIFVAFGFSESFAGADGIPDFKTRLCTYLAGLQSKAFNGETGPKIVLISPVKNENVPGFEGAEANNQNLDLYTTAMKAVADELGVGFADMFHADLGSGGERVTIKGCHLLRGEIRI